MKILIADKLAPEGAAFLRQQSDVEVTERTGLTDDDLVAALAAHDGVVVRSAVKIRENTIKAAMNGGSGKLRGIARAGVGVDNIDLDAATQYGIAVMNSASASSITTAEQAFALMIGLARNIGPASRTMAEGGWDRSKYTGTQLAGKTLGIVGFGRIGRTLASRAIAFGMTVIAYDPVLNAETALDGQVKIVPSFDELIKTVDIVSFHVPKTEATANMLSTEQFAMAKPGLLVVNASRGGIVDEDAIIPAIESGQCGGAALDVFNDEPPPADSPLRTHPKILCTPHLGASTVEAQEAVAVDACKALYDYLAGRGLSGAVNTGGLNLDLSDRQKQFADLARRMIELLEATTGRTRINRVTVTARGESIHSRADTIARFALASLLNRHLEDPVNVINAALTAEQRGIDTQTVIASEAGDDRLAIEVESEDGVRTIEGAILADDHPRITRINGYALDMIPAGPMVLLTNRDEPGRIGVVGQLFGESDVNIAEMVIGRRPDGKKGANVAMMILKLDQPPTEKLLDALRAAEGIIRVSHVVLPAE